MEVSKLLLSPYSITQRMTQTHATRQELPLLSFEQQILACCDGVARHLADYEAVGACGVIEA